MNLHQWLKQNLLQGFQEGTLSPKEQAKVARHLEQCSVCASALHRLRETEQQLRTGSPSPLRLAPENAQAVRDRVFAEVTQRSVPHQGSHFRVLALTTIVLLLGGGLLWQRTLAGNASSTKVAVLAPPPIVPTVTVANMPPPAPHKHKKARKKQATDNGVSALALNSHSGKKHRLPPEMLRQRMQHEITEEQLVASDKENSQHAPDTDMAAAPRHTEPDAQSETTLKH